jgi:hypothetical protein
VRIDPPTGYFSGRAWGENIGWVTFASGPPIASTVRTSWCEGTLAPPGSGFTLAAGKDGQSLQLSWSSLLTAGWYDIVRGNLNVLRSSGGDFTTAMRQCVVSRHTGTSFLYTGPHPPLGEGFWILVRGGNCRGHGTYESGSAHQSGLRDAEIAASGFACP